MGVWLPPGFAARRRLRGALHADLEFIGGDRALAERMRYI